MGACGARTVVCGARGCCYLPRLRGHLGELPVVPGCVREGPVVPGARGSGAVVVKKRACG